MLYMLNISYARFNSIFTIMLCGRYLNVHHFTDQETNNNELTLHVKDSTASVGAKT